MYPPAFFANPLLSRVRPTHYESTPPPLWARGRTKRRQAAALRRPLLLAWVVLWIHVVDHEGAHALHLNHRLPFEPGVVVHLRIHVPERSGRHGVAFRGVEGVAHPEVERAGNVRERLARRMTVRCDTVTVRHYASNLAR